MGPESTEARKLPAPRSEVGPAPARGGEPPGPPGAYVAGHLSPSGVLFLQRAAGNGAVAGLLARPRAETGPGLPASGTVLRQTVLRQEEGGASLDAAAVDAARKQIRQMAMDKRGWLKPIILQVRAFLQLSVTPTTALPPDQPAKPTMDWFGDDLIRAVADWQAGDELPVDGKLTAPTIEGMKRHGLGSSDWFEQLNRRDEAQMRLASIILGPQGPAQRGAQLSARESIVAAAESQIGMVNSLDRGDGKKFGWERLIEYYKVAGVYRPEYEKDLKTGQVPE